MLVLHINDFLFGYNIQLLNRWIWFADHFCFGCRGKIDSMSKIFQIDSVPTPAALAHWVYIYLPISQWHSLTGSVFRLYWSQHKMCTYDHMSCSLSNNPTGSIPHEIGRSMLCLTDEYLLLKVFVMIYSILFFSCETQQDVNVSGVFVPFISHCDFPEYWQGCLLFSGISFRELEATVLII